MQSQHAPCLAVNDLSGLFSQIFADVVIVVYLAEKADALAVLAVGGGQMFLLCDGAHLGLGQMADGEARLLQLPRLQLCQEICLVFHGVGAGTQPCAAVGILIGLGVVPRGNHVIILSHSLVEDAELDEAIAHHVGVGCESLPHLADGVVNHFVPVIFVQVNHLQRQPVFGGHGTRHLQILLDGAGEVCLVAVGADLDIPQVWAHALLHQQCHGHGTIYAARQQCCHLLVLQRFHV